MRYRSAPFFLTLLLVSIVGAGVADVVFSDVVPIRPYDTFFRAVQPTPQNTFYQAAKTPIGAIFSVALIILILGATAASLANATTGTVIAHLGFTPNPNVTKTPGLTAAIPILPLLVIGVGIGLAVDEMGGIL